MSVNKSKPVYTPLCADLTGRHHLLVGYADGSVPLRRVISQLKEAAVAEADALAEMVLPRTRILIAATPVEPFTDLGVSATQVVANTTELLVECRALLERSFMGTRLYVSGPELFIGRVMQIALEFNLNKDEVRSEALGTLARRVHCIHCRATTESVTTNIARCTGCSRWLLVRDHYSRRFAAYMGVMADAESPGELPPVEEIFA